MAPENITDIQHQVSKEDEGLRLDQLLSRLHQVPSRAVAQRWVKEGYTRVNRNPVNSPSKRVFLGDWVEVAIPIPQPLELLPEAGELEILYEDQDLVVLEKPEGLVIHPSPGHQQGTLVNLLLHHCNDLSGIGGKTRPGIVHRLDKDTSGVLVVAKNDPSHRHLAEQFRKHTVQRTYLALVWGTPDKQSGSIDAPLGRHPIKRKEIALVPGGRNAVTHWQVINSFRQMSLVSCQLETGRTHQIRVHLTSLGHPIVGDPLYSRSPQYRLNGLNYQIRLMLNGFKGQVLHAKKLGFNHPRTRVHMQFESPLPKYYQALLELLQQEESKNEK